MIFYANPKKQYHHLFKTLSRYVLYVLLVVFVYIFRNFFCKSSYLLVPISLHVATGKQQILGEVFFIVWTSNTS